jgi:hypothetical protein
MKFRLILAAVFLGIFTGGAFAQPILSVSINIPPITVNQVAESYVPMPIPVTVTIYNTGNVASQALSTRISFTADLELDASEFGAVIKTPVPAVVAPGDSAKVEWKLMHPVSFAMKNYRVRVWLRHTAVDSFETQKLFILPAMDPPEFKLTFAPVQPLQVRPDSLGYQQNPFPVTLRLANQGGTSVDSVMARVILPPDYVLDPSTQNNPEAYALPIPPPIVGSPRIEITWTIRYVGATRSPRTDTLRFRATGKDRAGGLVQKDTLMLINVDGLSPRYGISFLDPGAMEYDTATIYRPQPYPIIVRLTNLSEQWIELSAITMALQGEGVITVDPPSRNIPMLLESSHIDLRWNITAERRHAPRFCTAAFEVADSDGRLQGAVHNVSIPGQPYFLTIDDFQAPDTLATNAEGTAFLSNAIPLSFRFRNDTWYNGTVISSRVQSQGVGIMSPPYRNHAHALFLKPGDVSAAVMDTFFVQGQIGSRLLSFSVTAVSDRGDTARAVRQVFVPELTPVITLTHRGPGHVGPDMLGGYAPNPLAQDYVLHNEGSVEVRVDSIVLRYPMDGLVTPQPLRYDYGTTLRPGDSLLTRWNFSVYPRDTARNVLMSATAFYAGQFGAQASNLLRIDALVPMLDATVHGPDTLAYDPGTLYTPNPFTKTLRIRNSGTASLRLDSVALRYDDPLITPLDPLQRIEGRMIKPDSTIELSWRLQADKHDQATLLPMMFSVFHGGGTRSEIASSVYLPALVPGLETEVTGDARLVFDASNVYWPSPFLKTLRLRNSGNADLQLDSIIVSWTDPGISSIEAARMDLLQIVGAGASREFSWHFRAAPHASDGYVPLRFTIYHSGGQPYPIVSDVHVPGEAFAFSIVDAQLPDRIEARSDGQGYEGNPVVLRYALENNAWFATTLDTCIIELSGEGVQMLSPQPRPDNLLFAARERSPMLGDSFFVLPADFDRSITVTVTAGSIHGMGGRQEFTLFVPRISISAAGDVAAPTGFRVHALYPNPLAAGRPLLVDVEAVGEVIAVVYDHLGRELWKSATMETWQGRRTLALQIPALGQGSYLLRLRSGDAQLMQPFVILR